MYKEIRLVNNKHRENDILEEDLAECPDSFFTSIEVVDVLETSSDNEILQEVCSKVRRGGKLTLSGIDGYDLCRKIQYGEIGLEEANQSFFSIANRLNSVLSLKKKFKDMNWSVKFAGLKEGRYLVEVSYE
jgi:hypothetical protein